MCDKYILENHKQDVLNILENPNKKGHFCLKINFQQLVNKDPTLAENLLSDPETALKKWNDAAFMLQGTLLKKNPDYTLKSNINCRIYNLPPTYQSGLPGNDDVKKFLQITGTVVRMSARKLLEYQRQYVCIKCKYPVAVEAQYDKRYIIKQPRSCSNPEGCDSKTLLTFGELHSYNCKDYQEIKIQEDLSKLIGAVPNHMIVTLEDDLVNTCKPGENVTLTGVVIRRWSEFEKGVKILVDIVIRANYLEVNNSSGHSIAVSDDMKKFFDNFWEAHTEDPLVGRNIILKSIAPEIFGLNLIKLALAIVLAGGSQNKENEDNTGVDKRSESHLLFVGDPGTGKSQMLRFASKIIPGSILTTGVGSTGAGLTVTAVMDNGEWQLEAGALVMADGSLCCIDEFNSMKENDRRSIHEAMEQQTISVAKAGIVCKLKTRCIILASCNPKGGNLDPSQPLCMNVAMSSPLLSRFDLILLLRDVVNEENDRQLAEYLLNMDEAAKDDSEVWTLEMLQAYYLLIRKETPKLTNEAETILSTYYRLQKQFGGQSKARTTVRLLESLIRLSQGHAKLMFHQQVEIQDTIFAIALIDVTMDREASLLNLKLDNKSFSERPQEHYWKILKIILGKLNLDYIYNSESKKKRVEPFKRPAEIFAQKSAVTKKPRFLFTESRWSAQEIFSQSGTTCLRAIRNQNRMSHFTEDGGSRSKNYWFEEAAAEEPARPRNISSFQAKDPVMTRTTCLKTVQCNTTPQTIVVEPSKADGAEEEDEVNSDEVGLRRNEGSQRLMQMVRTKKDNCKIPSKANISEDSGNFTTEFSFDSRKSLKICSLASNGKHSKPTKEHMATKKTDPKIFGDLQSHQFKKSFAEIVKSYEEVDWDMDIGQFMDDIKSQKSQVDDSTTKVTKPTQPDLNNDKEEKQVNFEHLEDTLGTSDPKKTPKRLQTMKSDESKKKSSSEIVQSFGEVDLDMDFGQFMDDIRSQKSQVESITSESRVTESESTQSGLDCDQEENDVDEIESMASEDFDIENCIDWNLREYDEVVTSTQVDKNKGDVEMGIAVANKPSIAESTNKKPNPIKAPIEKRFVFNKSKQNAAETGEIQLDQTKRTYVTFNPKASKQATEIVSKEALLPKNRFKMKNSPPKKKSLSEIVKTYGEVDWDMDFGQFMEDIKSQKSQVESIASKVEFTQSYLKCDQEKNEIDNVGSIPSEEFDTDNRVIWNFQGYDKCVTSTQVDKYKEDIGVNARLSTTATSLLENKPNVAERTNNKPNPKVAPIEKRFIFKKSNQDHEEKVGGMQIDQTKKPDATLNRKLSSNASKHATETVFKEASLPKQRLKIKSGEYKNKPLSEIMESYDDMDMDFGQFMKDIRSQNSQVNSITTQSRSRVRLESKPTQSDLECNQEENEIDNVESIPSKEFDIKNCMDWNSGECDEVATSTQVDKNKGYVKIGSVAETKPSITEGTRNKPNPKAVPIEKLNRNFIFKKYNQNIQVEPGEMHINQNKRSDATFNPKLSLKASKQATKPVLKEASLPDNRFSLKTKNVNSQPVSGKKSDDDDILSKGKNFPASIFSAFAFQPREATKQSNKNEAVKTEVFNRISSNKLKAPFPKSLFDDEDVDFETDANPFHYNSQISERLAQNSNNSMKKVDGKNTGFSSQTDSAFSKSFFEDEDIDNFVPDVNPFLQASQPATNPSDNRDFGDMGQRTQMEFIRGKFTFKKGGKMLSRVDPSTGLSE